MKKRKLTNEELSYLCREMQLIVRSGMEMGGALALLSNDSADRELKAVTAALAEEIDSGCGLAGAVKRSGAFPGYVCALVEVGESTGKSEEALGALADWYGRQARLEQGMKNALLYPSVLLLVMLAVIVVLLTRVLPVFEDVYARLGASLGGAAGWMLSLGRALDALMPFLCLALAAVLVLMALFALSAAFREKVLAWWRGHFGGRGVMRQLGEARFAGALAMGLQSGMHPEEAMELASLTLAGLPAEKRCADCAVSLANGASLGKALMEAQLLPANRCRLLELGERSGCADTVMEEIAEKLTQQSEDALEKSLGRVEPTMVLVCSAIVGAVLLSVMLPLLNIMSAIG